MEWYNNINEHLMVVYRFVDLIHWLNSFDDKHRFLILHVRAFLQEKLFDYDYHSRSMEQENQLND